MRKRFITITGLILALAVTLLGSVQIAQGTATADPFDAFTGKDARGFHYKDTNGDGVIRPDRGRALGLDKAWFVDGADEVVILEPTREINPVQNASLVRTVGVAAAATVADCVKKYGLLSAEAYWWSPSGIKYTFKWNLAVNFKFAGGCTGYLATTQYVAGLYAYRLTASTPAYFRNDGASWQEYDKDTPNCGQSCLVSYAVRDFGAAYYSDGTAAFAGSEHSIQYSSRWWASESATLKAVFTAVDPDHETNVYRGCSSITNQNGARNQMVAC